MLSDAQLHRAFVAGDREAGGKIVDRHFSALRQFLVRRIPQSADDILQRVFLVYTERAAAIRTDNIKAFLFGVAYRQFLRELSKISRRRECELPAMSLVDSLAPGLSTRFAAKSVALYFFKALQSLPIQQQALIEMILFEGLRMQEAAEALEAPLNTCKGWRRKAILALRKDLNKAPVPIRQVVLAISELGMLNASGLRELLSDD